MAFAAAWQIVSCELASQELQSDLQDLSAQVGTKIGLNAERSDAELRESVLRKANQYDIELEHSQVTVKHVTVGSNNESHLYWAADYQVRVNLLVYSFTLYFNPANNK